MLPSQSSVLGCADKPFYYQPKTQMATGERILRIGIASHIVLDKIKSSDGTVTESIGGPPCYCGITSRRFGFDVTLATKAGVDFPKQLQNMLKMNDIALGDSQLVDAPTTKFQIVTQGYSRELLLIDRCKPLTTEDIQDIKVDCWLASPVIDELPHDVLAAIKQKKGNKNFVMLDPQGYLRLVDGTGYVTSKESLELDLSGITAIKVDSEENGSTYRWLEWVGRYESIAVTRHRICNLH